MHPRRTIVSQEVAYACYVIGMRWRHAQGLIQAS